MDQQLLTLQMRQVARLNGDDFASYGVPPVGNDPATQTRWTQYLTAVGRAASTPKESADILKTQAETPLVAPLAQAKISEAASAASQAHTKAATLEEEKRLHNLQFGLPTGPGETIDFSRPLPSPANETVAQKIANYDMDPVTGPAVARSGSFGAQIMARVASINPNWNAANYAAAKEGVEKFGAGALGSTVRSANAALDHLNTLNSAIVAMHNGDTPALNKLANLIATQTGQPPPTNFDALKTIVSNELVKFVTASGGTGGDREEIANTMKNANSPQQLFGVVNQYERLMSGQLNALERQYRATTGRVDFGQKYLSPEVQALRMQMAPQSSAPQSASGGPQSLGGIPSQRTYATPPPPTRPGQTLTDPQGQKFDATMDPASGKLVWTPQRQQ